MQLVKENINMLRAPDEHETHEKMEDIKTDVKDKLTTASRLELWEFMHGFFNMFEDDVDEVNNSKLEDFLYYNISHSGLRDAALSLLKDIRDYGYEDEDIYPYLNKFLNAN